ncbi:hypothetical protein BHM03_00036055 [Ensete ventricosum]|nr:hypothetical protein BHM03_00036055 [Ensete ventricosum]
MQVDGLEMRAYGDKRDEGVTETVSSSSSPPTHRRLQLAEPGPVTGAVQDNEKERLLSASFNSLLCTSIVFDPRWHNSHLGPSFAGHMFLRAHRDNENNQMIPASTTA